MAITTRAGKGSELSHAELDTNFTDLRDNPAGVQFPKASGVGIKIDPTAPAFGWHDILGILRLDPADVNTAVSAVYRGNIRQIQIAETKRVMASYHIPHDYVLGTDLFVHCHWSHASTLVTGGSCTWAYEVTYAKGHDQSAFSTPKNVTVLQNASTIQYQHMLAEGALSVGGGSATQLNTANIEPDGVMFCSFSLDSNDITVSSGIKPDPFVHFVDIHYQSTGIPTKQRQPNFYV